ncbi:AAA family ATPase [Tsukamurella pulmonis]|uniref:AAA family ATPase n=6 Tax=Tsukamurella TaxID=2060 RepID=A0A3P8K0D2_TSUPA|nr:MULTISPECIES: AAA family ATPase [Tsukamurella]KXO98934.1 AAA family ATPase [Tsukamurella tyrosinosolvens]KXP02032.1 AAA family ATPase [Tsukamurella tyrosinosolvens]KXP08230.1 AAA family ATPase [Tsukamurella pulmonis]KZL95098.1 AAA family ATPase [Tsukamurella tyrosinosolvens]MBS4104348.1 AAA family ATPase [Tsukamurella paurometabola]
MTETAATLDNLTLARKEGWQKFVNTPARVPPEALNRDELDRLTDKERTDYDRERREWHANLGPLKTRQLVEVHENLWDVIDSNAQDGDKPKGAVAIDAVPGLGKTTAVLSFARAFHRREVAENGTTTEEGHERWPVCRVGLTGNTGLREFNRAMLAFYAHPGGRRGNAADFAHRALDCVLACETKILIVDDLHFLRLQSTSGVEVSNHFKYIANEFPLTVIFAGVGLEARGLFSEGSSDRDALLAQTGRRTTRLTMDPFGVTNDAGRRAWRQTLKAIEQRVVLAEKYPGMIADDLSDYLYARCTGQIGSLMTLINRGCQRAVRTGYERLDEELLDRVKIDEASEKAREELRLAFDNGCLRTRIGRAG